MFSRPSLILSSVLVMCLTSCSSPAGSPAGEPDRAVLTLDLSDVPAATKVSYEFTRENVTIASEVVPSEQFVSIDHPELLGKAWQATIEVLAPGINESFKRSYRYSAVIFFDGNEIQVPSVGSAAWSALVFTEVALPLAPNAIAGTTEVSLDTIRVYWSADARTLFTVELRVPLGWGFRGVLDRSFWSLEGDPASELQTLAFTVDEDGARKDAKDEGGVNSITKGNEQVVEITIPEIDGVLWDQARSALSFLSLMNGFQWQHGYGWDHNIQLLFTWEVSRELSIPLGS